MRTPARLAALALAVLLLAAPAVRADPPAGAGTTESPTMDVGAAQMVVLDATDTAGLRAAVGKMVVVDATVASAEWSKSGKVLVVRFEGVGPDGFQAVVFDRDRKRLDEAFTGDLAGMLPGKTVKLRGVLIEYAGRQQSQAGRPELILKNDSQITVVPDDVPNAATTKPAA